MDPHRHVDLDALTEAITVDCYGEDEQLAAFATAFDNDAALPCPGSVVGEQLTVVSVRIQKGRRELMATCERLGRHYDIALLDIDIHANQTTADLIAAYRRWNNT
ncbi:MAG: hypothetical protein ACRDWV_00445 [Acidimicrobiales bacterium]